MPAPRLAAGLLVAPVFFATVAAADPPAKKAEADPVAAIRKAAETAEVHGVGVYGPAADRVGHREVADWPKVAEALRAGRGVWGRVREALPKDAAPLLADDKVVGQLGEPRMPMEVAMLKGNVAYALTKSLDRADLFDEAALKGVEPDKETAALVALGDKRTALQTARMNRSLLTAAFPGVVAAPPPHFRTVRVDVTAGRDVVLVLSSYDMCRWEVKVRDGGRVAGVVLCGYHASEVAGVGDVAVVHRTYEGPDGKELRGGEPHFRAPAATKEGKFEGKEFEAFAAKVKELTGKGFTDMQGGRPGPDREPFAIRPVAGR